MAVYGFKRDILLITLHSLSLLFNILVVFTILRRWKERGRYRVMAFSIALSDILFSIINLPIYITNFILHNGSNTLVVFMFLFHVSLCHIVLLALERFVAIVAPIYAKVNITKGVTEKLLIAIWIVLLTGYVTLGFCVGYVQKVEEFVQNNLLVGFAWLMLVATVFVGSLYAVVVYKLWNMRQPGEVQNKEQKRKHMKAVIYCLCLTVCFVLSHILFAVLKICGKTLIYEAHLLIILNAPCNALCFLIKERI